MAIMNQNYNYNPNNMNQNTVPNNQNNMNQNVVPTNNTQGMGPVGQQVNNPNMAMPYQNNPSQATPQMVDLGNTQVLNISDVERAYRNKNNKRPALMLAFAGLFAIVMGILYPIIMSSLEDEETPSEPVTEEKEENPAESETANSELACTYNAVASVDGVDTKIDINFTFNDNKLTNFTKTQNITPTAGSTVGATTLTNLATSYQALNTTDELPGYSLETTATQSQVTSILTVDMTVIDKTKLADQYKANTFTNVLYEKDQTKEQVMATAQTEGYTCK